MAALTKERRVVRMGYDAHNSPVPMGVAANTRIWQGAIVCNNAGVAVPGATATGLRALGIAKATADNRTGANLLYPGLGAGTGAANNITVDALKGTYLCDNDAGDPIAAADVGNDAYITDDQTVCKTSASNTKSIAGKIVKVTPEGVFVDFA